MQVESEPLPTTAGWAALGVLTVFVGAGVATRFADIPALAVATAPVAVLAAAAAMLGRYRWTFLPAAALSTAAITVLGNGVSSNVCWFALCVLAGWCALTAPVPVTAVFWAAATATLVTERLVASSDPGWFAWIGGTSFSVVGCLFARRQHDLVVQLREAQAGLAQRAQAEERNRIARELHDVIAHSLTVSLLHVASARLALRDDPAEAERALEQAERLSRASLEEVRHAVGALHRDGAVDPTQPLPGSIDVPRLIEGFRAAGADVRATVDGDLTGLPATVGLAAYRVLQEALTNAVKHAPGGRITVRVTVAEHSVRVDVDSDGEPGHGAGLGLVSMRERATSLGGLCDAGPSGNGWRVHAELPLHPRPVA
ncbi:MAG: sensor histidine kinase [Jatrophihabitans sp.]